MGLFGRKAAVTQVSRVEYDEATALPLGSVHNLRANIWTIEQRIGWDDRSQPSPTIEADLTWSVDTYGHKAVEVKAQGLVIGYLPRSANDKVAPYFGRNKSIKGAVKLSAHGNTTTAKCSLPQTG